MMKFEKRFNAPAFLLNKQKYNLMFGRWFLIDLKSDKLTQGCGYWKENDETGELYFIANPRHLKFSDFRRE